MSKKIVFIINHSAFFISHRLPLATAAIKRGFKVRLISGQPSSQTMEKESNYIMSKHTIDHKLTKFTSIGINPLKEFIGFIQIIFSLIYNRPSIIHTASVKGTIYGGLAARILRINCLVISISGLGFAFTGKKTFKKKIFSFFFKFFLKIICSHKNKKIIVQNMDDKDFILINKFAKLSEIELIKGSGVDMTIFKYRELDIDNKKIIFPARLLFDKGVKEFLESSEILSKEYPDWKFILAGALDYKNPTIIPKKILDKYLLNKNIQCLGYVNNMQDIFTDSAIVCLPSYREGMPKALLEAAAIGRAIVTTLTIGCKESIVDNLTGLLVPVKDTQSLTAALRKLIDSPTLRSSLGLNGRKFAEDNFDLRIVQNRVIEVYNSLILKK